MKYLIDKPNDTQIIGEGEKKSFPKIIQPPNINLNQNTEKISHNSMIEKSETLTFKGISQDKINGNNMEGLAPPSFSQDNESEKYFSLNLNNLPNCSQLTDDNQEPKNENQIKNIISVPKKISDASNKMDIDQINDTILDVSLAQNIMDNNKKKAQNLIGLEENVNETTNYISQISKVLNLNPDNIEEYIKNIFFNIIKNFFNYMKYIINVNYNIELNSSFIETLERKNINDYITIFEKKIIDLLFEEKAITPNNNELYILNSNNDIIKILSLNIRDIIKIDINDENEILQNNEGFSLVNFKTFFQQNLVGGSIKQKEKIKELIISLLNNNQIFEYKEDNKIIKGNIISIPTTKKNIFYFEKFIKIDSIDNFGDEKIKIMRSCFSSIENLINNLYQKYKNKYKYYQKLSKAYINQKIKDNNCENYIDCCNLKLYEALSNCYSKKNKKSEIINKQIDSNKKIFNYIFEIEKDIEEKSLLYLLLKETSFKTILIAFLADQNEITILNRTFTLKGFLTFSHYFSDYTNKTRNDLKKNMKDILKRKKKKEKYKGGAQKEKYKGRAQKVKFLDKKKNK